MSCLTIIGAFLMEWKSVKKEGQNQDGVAPTKKAIEGERPQMEGF
jgi:hypothetical protein